MGSTNPTRRGVATRFTAVDAARVALTRRPVHLTPARTQIMLAATVLWCRTLQFPTIRGIGTASGRRSPSSVVTGFGRAIDIQAAAIRTEWRLIDRGWLSSSDAERPRWLDEHRRNLVAVDPACLRLPGLVCSSVVASGLLPRRPAPELLAPLHGLAAFADGAGRSPVGTDVESDAPTGARLRLVHGRTVPA